MTATAVPLRARGIGTLSKRAWFLVLLVGAAVLYVLFQGTFSQPRADDRPFFLWLNSVRDLIRDNRDNPLFTILFTVPRIVIDTLVTVLTGVLRSVGWPALVLGAGALGLVVGGWRIAAGAALGLLAIGVLGLWESGVETLAAVTAAVTISFLIGVPIGIWMARSDRARAVITPILDVMQIMPTFAYLAPFVLFFGIGPAAAAIVTLIYAMPAAIRITSFGIRSVPANTVEAGRSLGSTDRQLLTKVQLPVARPAIALALNQTIMLAVSMIVITALIDAPGLGADTLRALIRNDVGSMFDAGIAIVILAIVLDRLTEKASERLDPRKRALAGRSPLPRRALAVAVAVVIVAAAAALVMPALRSFPDAIEFSFRGPINSFVDFLRSDVAWLSGGIKDLVSFSILNPVQTVFTQSPFWLTIAVIAGIALLVSGRRQALTAGVAFLLIFLMGLWQDAMETMVQVLVATVITFAIGLGLGILAARSDRFSRTLRPFLDIAQTMPSFVYLLPAFVLFDPSRFTAIFAAIIFALPPVIRLVEVGIRTVPTTIIEAATSSGSTARQLLTKVQLPVAGPALQLAANQAVILVLSMVVVGGLVGGQALGYDVVAGFSQNRLFGMGLAAGIALVLMGIALDRITQGANARPRLRQGG
ncbi:MAG TPA: ABC transporter permease subunit [Candidatus Limnocylindrales bacterium]|nr:ABC transporter permease subunit [Candidatus Limnocylindrales bacterium]